MLTLALIMIVFVNAQLTACLSVSSLNMFVLDSLETRDVVVAVSSNKINSRKLIAILHSN